MSAVAQCFLDLLCEDFNLLFLIPPHTRGTRLWLSVCHRSYLYHSIYSMLRRHPFVRRYLRRVLSISGLDPGRTATLTGTFPTSSTFEHVFVLCWLGPNPSTPNRKVSEYRRKLFTILRPRWVGSKAQNGNLAWTYLQGMLDSPPLPPSNSRSPIHSITDRQRRV